MQKSVGELRKENHILKYQLTIALRKNPRPKLQLVEKIYLLFFMRTYVHWKDVIVLVKPETVLRWHRQGFKYFWKWKSRPENLGRPKVAKEIRQFILRIKTENPTYGAPRIHKELTEGLGIEICEATVSNYLAELAKNNDRPPSGMEWKTFHALHASEIACCDFLTVPTLTFGILYCFVVMKLDSRKIIKIEVTANPTAQWTANQIKQAFPFDEAPKYLIRDNDSIYGKQFSGACKALGIKEIKTAPYSPWQNGYCERLVGSIKHECTNYIIPLNERHLHKVVNAYKDYYNNWRPHTALGGNTPNGRKTSNKPAGKAEVISVPHVHGLHHHYEWKQAA